MSQIKPTLAEEVAQAAIAFQRECTGVAPESVTVLLGEETLVVTLHEALSPAEKLMSRTVEGAERVQEFHRQLFQSSSEALHQELQRILGVKVKASQLEIEPTSRRMVEVFLTGDLVQVFRLAHTVAPETWSSVKKSSGLPKVF